MVTGTPLRPVDPVDADWLVRFVDAYSTQAQTGAQPGTAVTPAEAERGRPPSVVRVPRAGRTRIATGLWPVFAEGPDRADALNALAAEARLAPAVRADGSLGWTSGADEPAGRLLACCTATAIDLVTTRGWAALGTCAADDCADVHLAPPRGRPRRFCSTTCLNRSKARDHRARGREGR